VPAVFQYLIQKVLAGLDHNCKQHFVSVYLDDILIYPETLEDHLNYLTEIIKQLRNTGLTIEIGKVSFYSSAS